MTDDVKDLVDLAMDDKPNKAGEVLDAILRDRLAARVEVAKSELANQMFGQEYQPDAEPVEVQQELDLEPEDELDQAEEELVDDEGEEEPEQDEVPVENEEENEIT